MDNYTYDSTPQVAETDEQGNLYGYKVLVWDVPRGWFHLIPVPLLFSPTYPVAWENGELEADREPEYYHNTVGNHYFTQNHGIHFTKIIDNGDIKFYKGRFIDSYIVRCVLSGKVIETELGFRAQHANIVNVLMDDNWISYEEFMRWKLEK